MLAWKRFRPAHEKALVNLEVCVVTIVGPGEEVSSASTDLELSRGPISVGDMPRVVVGHEDVSVDLIPKLLRQRLQEGGKAVLVCRHGDLTGQLGWSCELPGCRQSCCAEVLDESP